MIELVQAPDTNRVIADGNDTIIQVRTTTGQDHFLRATIYINDVEFLKQGWSKDEDSLCSFNLKHLYYAYFSNQFTAEITTGFKEKTNLYKKVKIITSEYKIGSSVVVSTLELPEFYIIKNLNPQVFEDNLTVQFLGLPQENINVSRDDGFVFPLYLKAGELLTVEVLNPLGGIISSASLENYSTQVTQYELAFEDIPGVADLESVFVRFSTSQHQVQKRLKFINETIYPAKKVFYLNNCGFYCVAYLLGKKENNHSLSPLSYAQFDGTEVTYTIEDVKELRLSSGYGYKDITNLIHAIATSLDVRLQLDGYWERVKSETKKVQRFEDNKFIYFDDLQFSRVNVANFTNENTFAMVPEVADISKTGDENTSITITTAEFLNSYTATQSAMQLRIRKLPVNGKLSYQNAVGTYNLSDMALNDPSIIPFDIPLDDFIGLIYQPGYTFFGAPLDTVEFQMRASVLWSNIGDLLLNVNDLPDANLPPNIVVNSIQEVALDATGNGTKFIDASITDPDGDQLSILWEVLNAAPITFDNTGIEKPTITIASGTPNVTYQIKVTATDLDNNLVSEKIVDVQTSSYMVSINDLLDSGSGSNRQVNILGGEPTASVTIEYSLYSISFEQYAVINVGDANERIIYGGGSTALQNQVLDANGQAAIAINLVNDDPGSVLSLTARIGTVSGSQIIDENNRQITVSL